MELKCANDGKFKSNYAGFQSYLYGIEIVAGAYNEKPLQRFNRTFMELKLTMGLNQEATWEQFQSYLYGIEIEVMGLKFSDYITVSIVPLWN